MREVQLPQMRIRMLRGLELASLDRLILINHLTNLESLNQQVQRADDEIHSKVCEDEDVLIRSEIGSIERLRDYKNLASWAGIAPSLHQSGSVEYHGSITKQGSRILRWIIVEAARVAVNHDARMRAFHERVKHRRGDQKTRREPYGSRNMKRYQQKLDSITT